MDTKRCSKCGFDKNVDEFHFKSKALGTRQSRCKSCAILTTKAWQQANPERYIEQGKMKVKDELLVKARRYNIHPEDLSELRKNSSGVCDICKREPLRWLVVDHCHETNKVRGILCEPCNQALGILDDDVDRLRAAVLYLQKESPQYRPFPNK